MSKTYTDLIKLGTFSERLNYLKLNGIVSELTFGHNRYLNQDFYHSQEWLRFRRKIIIRDQGYNMALPDYEIHSKILIHHINPITVEDLVNHNYCVFDPDNVVCVDHRTHQAIHYGADIVAEVLEYKERKPNDTIPWRCTS